VTASLTARRDGFTFVELLLVLVLGLLLLGGAYGTLVRQEQAYGQLRAMAGTQQDARTGLELLSAELREVSAVGGDLLMATPDSLRFRALRKFGLVCDTDKNNKRLLVAQLGADPFASQDSIVVYVDQDSLMARDDIWQREQVSSVNAATSCSTTLGAALPSLLPEATLKVLTLQGAGLRFDSVFPGAPVRGFQRLTYGVATVDGEPMLVMRRRDVTVPLLGPLAAGDGLVFRYYDGLGTELTSFPLSAFDRQSVRRIRVEMRTTRMANSRTGLHEDSLFTDIFTRGS
jgi:prepilin-type N-terminal cleavage/methylation domain-containing protein